MTNLFTDMMINFSQYVFVTSFFNYISILFSIFDFILWQIPKLIIVFGHILKIIHCVNISKINECVSHYDKYNAYYCEPLKIKQSIAVFTNGLW